MILDSLKPHLSSFVFAREDGLPYTNKNLNSIWHQARKNTNINCKLNIAVRHLTGCQLLDQGENVVLGRELLGHTKTETTRRYDS